MAPVKIAMPPSRSGDERFSLCAISRFDFYDNNPDPKKNSILNISTFVADRCAGAVPGKTKTIAHRVL
jgi:hypothetical protein